MNYQSVITINFVEEPKYKMITADGYKADDIIKNISRMDPSKRFVEGETLIFFDELQEFPEIATALKFFKIDGRFDVICSGSMLGINYRKIESNSVGYKSDYEMFSLDFEEFLWAKGYDDAFIEDMLEHAAHGGDSEDLASGTDTASNTMQAEAVQALTALGYGSAESLRAVKKSSPECSSVEDILKEALKFLL